jgi:hypothetical protein
MAWSGRKKEKLLSWEMGARKADSRLFSLWGLGVLTCPVEKKMAKNTPSSAVHTE